MRMCRRRLGLTQNEFASLVGYERDAQVSRLETGQRIPRFNEALAIELICARALGSVFHTRSVEVRQVLIGRIEALRQSLQAGRTEARVRYKLARLDDLMATLRSQEVSASRPTNE